MARRTHHFLPSSCKHFGLPLASSIILSLATTIMASDPMDVDSIGGVPIKELHVLHSNLPPQTSRILSYSNEDSNGGMPIKELHLKHSIGKMPIKDLRHVLDRKLPSKTPTFVSHSNEHGKHDKNVERLQVTLHASTNSLSSRKPSPSSIPETCRFWLKGTCNRGAGCRFVHGGDSMKE